MYNALMKKQDEITQAKKRRAAYLKEFTRLDISISQFALLKGVTRQRMWKLLNMARADKT